MPLNNLIFHHFGTCRLFFDAEVFSRRKVLSSFDCVRLIVRGHESSSILDATAICCCVWVAISLDLHRQTMECTGMIVPDVMYENESEDNEQ